MRSLILFAIASAAAAQTWITMGSGGSIHETGSGVEFKYDVGAKGFAAAVQPVDSSFARMKSMRFRAKTDHDTTVGVLLSEKKPAGGNYVAMFWSPANQWQQIELAPRDFAAADGPNDAVDADGRLDLDQVEGVALFDMSHFLEGAIDREKIVVTTAPGPHSMFLDNLDVRSSGPAPVTNAIDTFDRGFLQWMTTGGMTLKFVSETGPLGEPSLKATYSETSGPYAIVVRRVTNPDLGKAKHLTFDIASENEATMLIALETMKGARYHLTIYPPAGRKLFHVDVALDEFEHESGDGPDKFDPSHWKTIALIDISGGSGANTYWLGNIRTKGE